MTSEEPPEPADAHYTSSEYPPERDFGDDTPPAAEPPRERDFGDDTPFELPRERTTSSTPPRESSKPSREIDFEDAIPTTITPDKIPDKKDLDSLVTLLSDVTLKIVTKGKKDEAVEMLVSFLCGYNDLIDQKIMKQQIINSLNSKDIGNLSIIIRTAIKGGRTSKDFWDKMDKQFYDILHESKRGFTINTVINIVLVTIGTALVVNSIIYTWIVGINGWSIFSGGIGLGTLVSLFFYRSQDAISKSVANLSIIDMVFKSHYRAYESITDYDYKADNTQMKIRGIEDLRKMVSILESTTKNHVDLIQKLLFIEKEIKENKNIKKEIKENKNNLKEDTKK